MSTWNVTWILARSSLPKVLVPDTQRSLRNCVRKVIILLGKSGIMDQNFMLLCRRLGRLPIPLPLMFSGAAQHDLPAIKRILEGYFVLTHGKLYADKTCAGAAWAEALKKDHALEFLAPRKMRKNDVLISGNTFSTFVSSIRQPIERFFN